MVQSSQTNAPFCSNCGYELSGLTESSKCPECGRPLVEVLSRRGGWAESGKRYRSKATIFGLPVIDVALGPKGGELRGRARGFIAVGDIATGWLAIGGVARGLVAIGGLALGLFSLGGMSLGLLIAMGGGAVGGFAVGGGAAGLIASGGGAVGYIAQGGGAVGYYARGGGAWGTHVISMHPGTPSPEAIEMFDRLSWLLGPWPPSQMLLQYAYPFAATLAVTVLIAAVAIVAMRADPDD